MKIFDVIIIGGGAAGLFAASQIKKDVSVLILEKNPIAGKKILISGKGRCNITNYCDVKELLANIPVNSKFLINALYAFTPNDIINYFNNHGLKTKIERGNRVFPVSDKASDVRNILLQNAIKSDNHIIRYNAKVIKIRKSKKFIVTTDNNQIYKSNTLLITTGGKSYPGTGSTGDGFNFAKSLGHTIITPRGALVPIEVEENFIKDLQGLSLRNIRITLFEKEKIVYKDFGEMIFTHFGISGPIILTMSSFIKDIKNKTLQIDFKPALSYEKLNDRILREIHNNPKRQIKFLFKTLLPSKIIPVFIKLSKIDAEKKLSLLTKQERKRIINLLKNFKLALKSYRPISEAIITSGGIIIKEINPKTMESKLVKNLYFAGEIIDCDALTGGFNFQIAWSTAFVAAKDINKKSI